MDWKNGTGMKLNLGSGNHPKGDEYINIDIMNPKADLICDCTQLPFEADSIDVIETYHMIEHLERAVFVKAVFHWYKLLKPKRFLIIECPDIRRAMRWYLEGNQEMMFAIYGGHRYEYDAHLWGYEPKTLCRIMEKAGFVCHEEEPKDYHSRRAPKLPCLRIVGQK